MPLYHTWRRVHPDRPLLVISPRVITRDSIVGTRPAGELPACQVEDHRGGHDRDRSHVAHGQAASAFAQPSQHAVGSSQAERRATREQDRVNALDEMSRIHHIELTRAGRSAAYAHRRAHARFGSENDGATGPMRFDRGVPDSDAGDRREIRASAH
jgi:hypothetical protein